MNLVLDYIEDNLDGEIEENKIAELSASPKGMFQRIFSILTDMSLSEYIRKRRLTQAVFDIQNTDEKIIDIAIKYGYNSGDAFSFAFKAFHGVTPSDAKNPNVELQSFYPFVFEFKLSIKGGKDMQTRIIENVDVKVELGRVTKSDNEIVFEIGRTKLPEADLKGIAVGGVIQLDKKVRINNETNSFDELFDVLVNGQIAAKGKHGGITDDGVSRFKIIEVVDKENNIANLEAGDVIELDNNAHDLLDVFANGELIAKGKVVIILNDPEGESVTCDGNFSVVIEEIMKTD
jgi:AraC-like DNA-binding protein